MWGDLKHDAKIRNFWCFLPETQTPEKNLVFENRALVVIGELMISWAS